MIFLNIGLIWQEQAGRSKEGQFLFRKADKIQSPLYWSPPSLSLSEKYVAKVFSKCGNYIFPTSFDIFKWHLSKYLCQPNCQNWMTRWLNITILWILCNHLHIRYLSQTCLWSIWWRHLVAKFLTNASGVNWLPNFLLIQVTLADDDTNSILFMMPI